MISPGRLDAWLRGVRRGEAKRAVVALGIRLDDLGAAQVDLSLGLRARVVRWTLDDEGFLHRSQATPAFVAATMPPARDLRLAVRTTAEPRDLVRRLLDDDDVSSAFVAVERPPTSLRRRAWRWPLRIGLVGFPEGAADAIMTKIRRRHRNVSRMLDVRRIEDDPAAVDVLVVEGPPAAAVDKLVRLKPVGNAVIVLDSPREQSSLIEAHLATARASSAAVASALVPPTDLPKLLADIAYNSSHAQPFDVALTAATGRDVLLWAEPEALAASAVPEIAMRTADELERITFATVPERLATLPGDLRTAAEGAFRGEEHEATRVAEMRASIDSDLGKLEQKRWCQAYVGVKRDNVLRRGKNPVSFFIGPLEEGALAPPTEFDDDALPWEEEKAEAFRLTVVFIPLGEDPVPQQAELELPRFGRSGTVPFELNVTRGAQTIAARILVLFRNRILQSALLSGRVGEIASLTEVVAWIPSLTDLDDRRPFDVALFANHTNGRAGLTRHSNGSTRISAPGGVPAITERIATVLALAAEDSRSTKKGLRSKAARDLLIKLAVHGHDLYDELEQELGGFAGATRIQLVSARSTWFLPLEVAYARQAPVEGATICQNYLNDPATCDGLCTPPDDISSLCPNAFWGLSKTIEHRRLDVDLEQGHLLEASERSRSGLTKILIERALFGASRRVNDADSKTTATALGHGAAPVASWEDWERALAARDTQLLVLLPHTDYGKATLEIASKTLERGRIESRYVTGNRDVDPIVVLFGCRTTGNSGDPAGFAARFMQKGAGAVFHSSTDLRNVHATELARRLTGLMTQAGHHPQPLSDALLAFRREAVYDGVIVAFAISALGDADLRV